MRSMRHRVSVVCKPGPFAIGLRHEGIYVIETEYSQIETSKNIEAIENLHNKYKIDLIHAHPFASRELGLIASQVFGLPFVVTLHGKYQDELTSYIEKTDVVMTVSEGIRHYLLTDGSIDNPEKLHVVPNTPNSDLFQPTKATPLPEAGRRMIISLVTRLDSDKTFILDIFYQAVAYAAEVYPGRIHWQVVGQGTQEQTFFEKVEALRGKNTVSYAGWLQNEALRDAYCISDAAIAPGRCALEALSCGVPVIALGSKGYNGIVGSETWQEAVFSNFGGVGNKHEGYIAGAVEQDIDLLMISADYRHDLGTFGRQLVHQFFNADDIHQRLFGFYNLAIASYKAKPRDTVSKSDFLALRLRNLKLERLDSKTLRLTMLCEPLKGLKFAWYLIRDDKVVEKYMYKLEPTHTINLVNAGRYQVRCFVQDEKKRKLSVYSPIIDILDS